MNARKTEYNQKKGLPLFLMSAIVTVGVREKRESCNDSVLSAAETFRGQQNLLTYFGKIIVFL